MIGTTIAITINTSITTVDTADGIMIASNGVATIIEFSFELDGLGVSGCGDGCGGGVEGCGVEGGGLVGGSPECMYSMHESFRICV